MPISFAKLANRYTSPPAGAITKTDNINVFTTAEGTQKYILLDATDEGFFILNYNYVGRLTFDPDNTLVYDSEDYNNIAYQLNNQYLTSSLAGQTMEKAIQEHLVLRKWPTESGNDTEEYTYPECKVALISIEEYLKYIIKIGTFDDESWWGWYSRSPYLNTPTKTGLAISGQSGGAVITVDAQIACGIRPVFYLDRDFFKEVKINLNTVGHNIRKAMQENYTRQELSTLYGESELNQIFSEVPPIAYDVWSIGYNNVGDTMTGYYKYSSPEGKPEKGTTYRWVRCDDLTGSMRSAIQGATGMTYTLTEEDAGKYVFFEVTPASATAVGDSYLSLAYEGRQVVPAHKPTAEDIAIVGKSNYGEVLEVIYLFRDNNRELEGETRFQWQREKNGTYYNIPGATEKSYTVTGQDIGYRLRCCITPVSSGTYDTTGYKNNGKYSVGDACFSELTEIVVALPKAENVILNNRSAHSTVGIKDDILTVSLLVKGEDTVGKRLCINYDYSDFSGIAEGASEYVWEISDKKDGKFIALEKENQTEYQITSGITARYIRCGVTPVNKYGTRGVTVYSEPLLIAGEEYEFSKAGVDSSEADINTPGDILITAEKLKNPYIISFKLTVGENTKITNVTSSDYNVYTNEVDGGLYCMLIKSKNVIIENGTHELATVSVETSGKEKVYLSDFTYAGIGFDGKAENNTYLPEAINLSIK